MFLNSSLKRTVLAVYYIFLNHVHRLELKAL